MSNIDDYKDRMTSPIGAVRIDPVTGEPLKNNNEEKTGYIYVLTNKSFHCDDWIKIGYAEDVNKRVKELSNTSVPLPYEVYCTYEIPRIKGIKDPDKLLHNLIEKINPDLRIVPNREFFEMQPWAAYEMLYAMAQMHGRVDKLKRYSTATDEQDEAGDYSVDTLFPVGSQVRALYEKLKSVILSLDTSLMENPKMRYVSFKKSNKNVVSLWPKSNWVEVVLNAKTGQINDPNDLVYDISNRQWSSEQYAFKFYSDTDLQAATDLIKQALELKK